MWINAKTRDVRFSRAGTVSLESLPSKFGQNSVRNHWNSARNLSEFVIFFGFFGGVHGVCFSGFFYTSTPRNPETWRNLSMLYGISRNSQKIAPKSVQNSINIVKNSKFSTKFWKFAKPSDEHLLKYRTRGGAKESYSCRSRKMLQTEYLVTKIGFDTAEI